jgi:hypothetical protein
MQTPSSMNPDSTRSVLTWPPDSAARPSGPSGSTYGMTRALCQETPLSAGTALSRANDSGSPGLIFADVRQNILLSCAQCARAYTADLLFVMMDELWVYEENSWSEVKIGKQVCRPRRRRPAGRWGACEGGKRGILLRAMCDKVWMRILEMGRYGCLGKSGMMLRREDVGSQVSDVTMAD